MTANKANNTTFITWSIITIMVLSGGIATAAVLNKKRKEATIPILIAALKDTSGKYGDSRDLSSSPGFNPGYATTSSLPKLDYATYTQAAKDIKDAFSNFGIIAGLGTESAKIFNAVGKAANQAQLSQITQFYNTLYKSDLLTDLKKYMSSGDYQKLSDQVAKIPTA